jgi:hypothetical protein
MLPLRFGERCALAALGAAACAAALAISIDDARGAAGTAVSGQPRTTAAAPRANRDVFPARDPFGGDPALTGAAPAAPSAGARPVPAVASLAAPPPPTAFVPSAAAARVTATVTGARQFAVLDGGGGATRIVTVGDAVGARSVVAIDANGLHLSDRTTLSLAVPGRVLPSQGERSP